MNNNRFEIKLSPLIILTILINFKVTNAYSQYETFDKSFGVNGISKIGGSINYSERITNIAKTTENKYIVSGITLYDTQKIFVSRINNAGIIDSTFGKNGIKILQTEMYNNIRGMKLFSNNKIIIINHTQSINLSYSEISCLLPNGNIDSTFGNNGKIVYSNEIIAFSLFIDENDNLFVAGNDYRNSSQNSFVCKYNSSGVLINSFGNNGCFSDMFGANRLRISDINIHKNGKIILAGNASYNSAQDYPVIFQLNSNGTIDSTYGEFGVTHFRMTSAGYIQKTAFLNDNSIIAAGNCETFKSNSFFLAKITPNGQIDSGFSGSLFYKNDFSKDEDIYNTLCVDQYDNIYAGGYFRDSVTHYEKAIISAFNSNGNLISNFSNNGHSTYKINNISGEVNDMILDNGYLIVAGKGVFNNLDGAVIKHAISCVPFNKNIIRIDNILKAEKNNSFYQWYSCNSNFKTILNNQNNQTFIMPTNGSYAVEINESGCSDTSSCNTYSLSIKNQKNDSYVSFYPNPIVDYIYFNDNYDGLKYYIFDNTGKCTMEGIIENSKIEINELCNGLYYIVLSDSSIISGKFIKQ